MNATPETPTEPRPWRPAVLERALRLEYVTVGFNVVEGLVALAAAVPARSVALVGLGVDSFVETAAGLILVWRIREERRTKDAALIERIDLKAQRLVAASLWLLAAWIAFDAARTLALGLRPQPSFVGLGIATLSIVFMAGLARSKGEAASALGSNALRAGSFQATACWWMSILTLGGIGLNALFGWWWADPVAALCMPYLLLREGQEAWRGAAD